MNGRITRTIFSLAVALLVVGAIGLALSNQWYADDACQIEEWKCGLGSLGMNASFYALPLGVLLAVVALVAWLIEVMSRRQ